MESYYYIDWIAMLLTLLSIYLLGQKKANGFLLGMLANIFWLIFGCFAQSLATIIANFLFFLINGHGYWQWVFVARKKTKAPLEE